MLLNPGALTALRPAPPLGLAYVAAALRKAGHDVGVIDAIGEAPDQIVRQGELTRLGLSDREIVARIEPQTQAVGLANMWSFGWPTVRHLVHAIKKSRPELPIVGGGEHFSAAPEHSMREAPLDYIVLGEGEETAVRLFGALQDRSSFRPSEMLGICYRDESGGCVRNPRAPRAKNIDDIPWPAWDLFDLEAYDVRHYVTGNRYGKTVPILATRGCPYQCTFCSSPQMWTTRWVPRNPVDVVDEIETYVQRYGANHFPFQDLTSIIKRDWIIAFCKELLARGLDVRWQLAAGTRCEVIDDEVVSYLYRSGCKALYFAPESGSERVRNLIKKRLSTEALMRATECAIRGGLNLGVFLVIGFPKDTLEDLEQTVALAKTLGGMGLSDVSCAYFFPIPSTELSNYLLSTGRIRFDDDFLMTPIFVHDKLMREKHNYCENVSARTLTKYKYKIVRELLLRALEEPPGTASGLGRQCRDGRGKLQAGRVPERDPPALDAAPLALALRRELSRQALSSAWRVRILVLCAALLAGTALNWPMYRAGLSGDDYVQQTTLRHQLPIERGPLGAYNAAESPKDVAALRDVGFLPWWVGDNNVSVHARPLSSLLLWLDVKLGLSPIAQHLHSWLWWALGVVGLGALALRLAGPGVGALATLLYATAPGHAIPLAWLANRTAHVSAAFGTFAVWALVGYLRAGHRKSLLASLALFALALAGGEYAMGYCALALGLCLMPAPGARRRAATLSVLGLFAATLLLRVAFHVGVRGNGMYADPVLEPMRFASMLAIQLPALFIQLFTLLPGEGMVSLGRSGGLSMLAQLWGVALLVALVLIALARGGSEPNKKLAVPVVLGTALSVAPFCAVDPSVRLLVIPAAGAALTLALALNGAWQRARRPGLLRFAAAPVGLAFALLHFAIAPVGTFGVSTAWSIAQGYGRRFLLKAAFSPKSAADRHVVLLRANELIGMYYAPYMLVHLEGHAPESWRTLVATRNPLTVRRIDAHTLELSVSDGNLFDARVAKMLPMSPAYRRVGAEARTPDVHVTVLAANQRPTRIRFTFTHPLDDAHSLVLDGNGEALAPVSLPAPGKELRLPQAGSDP